jgi:hypothetical protein
MSEQLLIDLVTDDPVHDECVLYLIEEGPWDADSNTKRLRSIQSRLYNAVDSVVDGLFAARFPDSSGRNIRIQVDGYNDPPPELDTLVSAFEASVHSSPEYKSAIERSAFVQSLRVVSRSMMGRADQSGVERST